MASVAIKEELEYLYQILEELERKCVEKTCRVEELKDEIEFINKEKSNLKKYIEEKEDEKEKAELQTEMQVEELLRQQYKVENKQKQSHSYFDLSKATTTTSTTTPTTTLTTTSGPTLDSTSFFPSIIRSRINSVKNNGEPPTEEFGNSKWMKKK